MDGQNADIAVASCPQRSPPSVIDTANSVTRQFTCLSEEKKIEHRKKIHEWLDENYIPCYNGSLTRASVYGRYVDFCQGNNILYANSAQFGRILAAKYLHLWKKRVRNVYYHVGIVPRPTSEQTVEDANANNLPKGDGLSIADWTSTSTEANKEKAVDGGLTNPTTGSNTVCPLGLKPGHQSPVNESHHNKVGPAYESSTTESNCSKSCQRSKPAPDSPSTGGSDRSSCAIPDPAHQLTRSGPVCKFIWKPTISKTCPWKTASGHAQKKPKPLGVNSRPRSRIKFFAAKNFFPCAEASRHLDCKNESSPASVKTATKRKSSLEINPSLCVNEKLNKTTFEQSKTTFEIDKTEEKRNTLTLTFVKSPVLKNYVDPEPRICPPETHGTFSSYRIVNRSGPISNKKSDQFDSQNSPASDRCHGNSLNSCDSVASVSDSERSTTVTADQISSDKKHVKLPKQKKHDVIDKCDSRGQPCELNGYDSIQDFNDKKADIAISAEPCCKGNQSDEVCGKKNKFVKKVKVASSEQNAGHSDGFNNISGGENEPERTASSQVKAESKVEVSRGTAKPGRKKKCDRVAQQSPSWRNSSDHRLSNTCKDLKPRICQTVGIGEIAGERNGQKGLCISIALRREWTDLSEELKDAHKQKVCDWLGRDYCVVPQVCLPRTSVYSHYEAFCKKNQLSPSPPEVFGRMLKKRFPTRITMRRLGGRGDSRYYYMGIHAREHSDYYRRLNREKVVCLYGKPKFSRAFNGPRIKK